MQPLSNRPADSYSPLYLLASLGAGGLAVTFFMYLMFWVPHTDRPVPVFADLTAGFTAGSIPMQAAIIVAVLGIAAFAFLNLRLLVWNITQYRAFARTPAFAELTGSNAETQLLALPLALAMSVNVGFILGLVFVPGLWSIVEYLFPMALIAFAAIGVLAFVQLGRFLGRVLSEGGVFDVTAHNSFAQLLPAFALSMVAVGFAAPAAMSTVPMTVGISLIGSTFFGVTAMLYAVIAAITGFNSMLHYGTARESGPTLMVVVPIITVLGIMFTRQDHGMHATFEAHTDTIATLMFLSRMLAVQVAFLLLGMVVLRRQGYFRSFVFGAETSPGSYALVCPGVALSVMLHFWINKGLVGNGLIDKFGLGFWVLTALALVFQIAMIWLVLRLNRQHFGQTACKAPVPAE